jgi:hypothetical protein
MYIPSANGPEPPVITKKDIWKQFRIDIAGKEVQTAETYSHSWVANQFGHVCLGIILASLLSVSLGSGLLLVVDWFNLPASWTIAFPWYDVVGSALAALVVAAWEWRAYSVAVRSTAGVFPLDRRLLRHNALTATAYMVLGVATAFVFRFFAFGPSQLWGLPPAIWGTLWFIALVAIAILLALPWLRQKIIWQKAALPYLYRLADAQAATDEDAQKLQALINTAAPPECPPHQIIIGGPIGSGRTEFGAGIGTEFAFRNATVRYLSATALLEFAARSEQAEFFDHVGPANIAFWPWSRTQVLIIDDIGPLLTAKAPARDKLFDEFARLLAEQLHSIRPVLERCHTVWVVGDPGATGEIARDDESLDRFAREVGIFCTPQPGAQKNVVVVQLEDVSTPQQIKKPRARVRHVV